MDVKEYISGEKLQELAEHSVLFDNQMHLNALAIPQLKNTKCEYTIIDNNNTINDKIKNAKSLFIYTQSIQRFFNDIFPQLNNPINLVSHNSDIGIGQQYKNYIEDNKIIAWYSQNVNYKHEKLIPIPIGIANSQWPHGNISTINNIREQNNKKDFLVYKNFNTSTSYENRGHVDAITARNGIIMNKPEDNISYLTQISKSLFCICPHGAGLDTHRVWEALYLRTIPVVPDCHMYRSFNLPMVYVNDWNTITPKFLEDQFNIIKNIEFNYEKLKLSYWSKCIHG